MTSHRYRVCLVHSEGGLYMDIEGELRKRVCVCVCVCVCLCGTYRLSTAQCCAVLVCAQSCCAVLCCFVLGVQRLGEREREIDIGTERDGGRDERWKQNKVVGGGCHVYMCVCVCV